MFPFFIYKPLSSSYKRRYVQRSRYDIVLMFYWFSKVLFFICNSSSFCSKRNVIQFCFGNSCCTFKHLKIQFIYKLYFRLNISDKVSTSISNLSLRHNLTLLFYWIIRGDKTKFLPDSICRILIYSIQEQILHSSKFVQTIM